MKSGFWKVFLCALFLGSFGVHRFFLGKTKSGIIQLVTLGGLGIWTLIDLIQILRGKFTDAAGNVISNPKPKTSWAIAIFIILVALGASSSSDSTPTATTEAKIITKAEWHQKLQGGFGNMAAMGYATGWSGQKFKQLMGKPDETQTIGDSVYWYYECSDGRVQLELNAVALNAAGLMQGHINDY